VDQNFNRQIVLPPLFCTYCEALHIRNGARGESLKHLHRAFFKANQESVVFIASSSSPLIYLTKRIRESESGDEKPFPV
jgi:hypothetical protein